MAGARLPQHVPQRLAVLARAVELPAQLTDVRDPHRQAWHVADRDLLRRHVAEGLVRELALGQRRQHVARPWPPQAEARQSRGDVVQLDAAVPRQVLAHPAQVVVAEGRAGDDPEPVAGQPRDREVALDAAACVQHLGVGDGSRRTVDVVCAQVLKQRQRARSLHLELGE